MVMDFAERLIAIVRFYAGKPSLRREAHIPRKIAISLVGFPFLPEN